MGKVVKRIYTNLIEPKSDRHSNKFDIYFCKDNLYHINFRNLQLKLNEGEYQELKNALKISRDKLGNKMKGDI